MNIPKNIRLKWKRLRSKNDIKKLAAQLNTTTATISRAINQGTSSVETFEAISEFYKTREQLLENA